MWLDAIEIASPCCSNKVECSAPLEPAGFEAVSKVNLPRFLIYRHIYFRNIFVFAHVYGVCCVQYTSGMSVHNYIAWQSNTAAGQRHYSGLDPSRLAIGFSCRFSHVATKVENRTGLVRQALRCDDFTASRQAVTAAESHCYSISSLIALFSSRFGLGNR